MGSSEDTSVAESATRPTSTGTPKAASCALVYSDVRHVLNITRILEDIEEVLFEHGLAAQRLGRAARTGLARSVEVLMERLGLTHRTTFVVGLEQLTRRMTRDSEPRTWNYEPRTAVGINLSLSLDASHDL